MNNIVSVLLESINFVWEVGVSLVFELVCNMITNQTSPQFIHVTFAIDIIYHTYSNEAHCEFLPARYNAVLAILLQQKAFNQLYITNKMERFSFKSGRTMRV